MVIHQKFVGIICMLRAKMVYLNTMSIELSSKCEPRSISQHRAYRRKIVALWFFTKYLYPTKLHPKPMTVLTPTNPPSRLDALHLISPVYILFSQKSGQDKLFILGLDVTPAKKAGGDKDAFSDVWSVHGPRPRITVT